ncbi:NFACT RNA binding domain-containing protein [Fulvivirga ulvae]|uniref:NFACT RNA binding domain-containing protein n=1 Tax=Fulvivirga ulvae TaxID=2904245 RepID=UPI001F1A0D01|nr:NFACT RNA binding domain-containing protein [Fulvivirga ulvae]UII29975.1 NFACT RNA binding domain-containing protein [Fulvivirga ulvae]
MHNNYYFLKDLSAQLDHKLTGLQLVEAFSQNKNELVIGFTGQTEEFYIKAHLDPAFCCLSFPEGFSRARKNSVDLFTDISMAVVEQVRQFDNERSFVIIFQNNYQLLFKMHGNRSNIVLFKDDVVTEVFKKSLKKDFEISITNLDRPIDQTYNAFVQQGGDYKELFPTFGKVIKKHLLERGIKAMDTDSSWELIEETVAQLTDQKYYITKIDNQLHLSLLRIGSVQHEFNNPLKAIDHFFIQYISEHALYSIKNEALLDINKQLRQSESYVKKTQKKLEEIESRLNYSILADILMANLHQISPKAEEVTLQNFYDNNTPLTIKLKRDLSPQKNAEAFYRKSKNQSVEIENLKTNLKQKLKTIEALEEQKLIIEEEQNLKALRNLVKKDQHQSSKKKEHLPFNTFTYDGFDIWVGKNARSNDLMLQQYSFKDDLWLHAKDVSGSHVLIKHKAGKPFPKDVIEKAAELAAHFSKRKSDTLCPVIVTPRKFVRKRKGDPAGAVMVDKEEKTLLVRPNNWS